ncbi:hypothetical protein J6590_031235 [Homalodisca vitripennis]|nr:hypothetical protein J6590_031235 [Homalodisca vitripennis]
MAILQQIQVRPSSQMIQLVTALQTELASIGVDGNTMADPSAPIISNDPASNCLRCALQTELASIGVDGNTTADSSAPIISNDPASNCLRCALQTELASIGDRWQYYGRPKCDDHFIGSSRWSILRQIQVRPSSHRIQLVSALDMVNTTADPSAHHHLIRSTGNYLRCEPQIVIGSEQDAPHGRLDSSARWALPTTGQRLLIIGRAQVMTKLSPMHEGCDDTGLLALAHPDLENHAISNIPSK